MENLGRVDTSVIMWDTDFKYGWKTWDALTQVSSCGIEILNVDGNIHEYLT
jgi:hypothetical protein